MNQLPFNPLHNTSDVFHQVATGENRRRSRYIKLENGKDVFTNNRRERTDLRVVFDDAQKQIRDALLSVNQDSLEETKRNLTAIVGNTRTIRQRYQQRAGNIFVRLGWIKPKVRRETLEKGEQLEGEALAASHILEVAGLRGGGFFGMFKLKESLEKLCRHDSGYIFELLQLSGAGGSFEFCHKQLEEIATDQFKSLFHCINTMGDLDDCVFEEGRYVLKRVDHPSTEKIQERNRRLSDLCYDFLPYINYRSLGNERSLSPFSHDEALGSLWRRLDEGTRYNRRKPGDVIRNEIGPTIDEMPIWSKIANDLDKKRLLKDLYISLLDSKGRKGFYTEFSNFIDRLEYFMQYSYYQRVEVSSRRFVLPPCSLEELWESPSRLVKSLYSLAHTGLMEIDEFRKVAGLTDFYSIFFEGKEPDPNSDYPLRVLHLILKENDFPNKENRAAVTSRLKDIYRLYNLEQGLGSIPENYRFADWCKLLQKEWLAEPQYVALLNDEMVISRAILTDTDLPEDSSPSQQAFLEVLRALNKGEINSPQEAEVILNAILKLQSAYEEVFDFEGYNCNELLSKFSSAHNEVGELLETFTENHPIKKLMDAPQLPEDASLRYRVSAFILSKIASREMQNIDEAGQLFSDLLALSKIQQKIFRGKCNNENYKHLLSIVRRDVAKNPELIDVFGEDVILLKFLADPNQFYFDDQFDLKVLALALKEGASDEIMEFRSLSAFEEASEVSFGLWDPDSNEALLKLLKLRRELEGSNESLSNEIKNLFPRAYEFGSLVNLPAQENEHFAVSAMRFCMEQGQEPSWNTLTECFLFMQGLFLDNTNEGAVWSLTPKIDEISPPVLKFLEEKLPFVVYAMKVKKRTPNVDCCTKDTPIDDLILWGRNLEEYRSELEDLPVEEWFLAFELGGHSILDSKNIAMLGRMTREDFKPMAEVDDAFLKRNLNPLVDVGAEVRNLKADNTAISLEYALELQQKYGTFSYNDSYTVQKRLFDNENSGDCVAVVNGKERKLHSQIIQRALPGIEILDKEARTIKLPEQLSPEELNAFLEYCYTGSIAYASDALLMALYNKGELIGSKALQGYCCAILIATVSKDNVLKRYHQACQMGVAPLIQHCVRFLQAYYYRYREHFSEDEKGQIAQIVTTFFDPPVVTPQPLALDPVIWEPNFTLKGKDGKEVQINLELMLQRSNLFNKMAQDIDLEPDLKELEITPFDSQTLSHLAHFVANGTLPRNLSRGDLIELKKAADFFDMPMLQFRINELLVPRS